MYPKYKYNLRAVAEKGNKISDDKVEGTGSDNDEDDSTDSKD